MFFKVCPDTGFNDQAVAHWNFELVPPPDPPVAQAAPSARGSAGRSDVSRAEAHRAEATRSAAAREEAAREEEEDKDKRVAAREAVPTPQEEVPVPQPVPTLTLYFIGGGELKLEGTDAEKVNRYYSVPSSFLTVL